MNRQESALKRELKGAHMARQGGWNVRVRGFGQTCRVDDLA